jgi:uncharacterized protein
MIISADTNVFLHAANPDSKHYAAAQRFFAEFASGQSRFLICELVLIEIYMQLRNPAVFRKTRSARQAADFCDRLRANTMWEKADYEPSVARPLWEWAAKTTTGFRHIIDARLAMTLRYQGVTHFATANVKDFEGFGFEKVWNPLRLE